MNTKRRPIPQFICDFIERLKTTEDGLTTLSNRVDNLDISQRDIKPRLTAVEVVNDTQNGRLTLVENNVSAVVVRVNQAEQDIDNLESRATTAEGNISGLRTDVDAVDARVTGIETGAILLSQLVIDADKDFKGKNIVNLGLVDGVDVSEHTHNGTDSKAINLKDVEVTEDKDFGGKQIKNITGVYMPFIDIWSGPSNFLYTGRKTGNIFGWEVGQTGALSVVFNNAGSNFRFNKPINPLSDSQLDIGASTQKWKDLYLSGNINIGGAVDGVDVSEHVHDGTAVGGKKIDLKNISISEDKNLGGFGIANIRTLSVNQSVNFAQQQDQMSFKNALGNLDALWMCKPDEDKLFRLWDVSGGNNEVAYISRFGDIWAKRNINVNGNITQNNGMPVASCPVPFRKDVTINALPSGSSVLLNVLPSNRNGIQLTNVRVNTFSKTTDGYIDLSFVADDDTEAGMIATISDTTSKGLDKLISNVDLSAKRSVKNIKFGVGGTGTVSATLTCNGYIY